jgi:NAD(P)-dependent dehydrogenase (short-subunit alcohol dehydrogenase family)
VAVNVRAVFVATQAAIKHMKEGGRIQYRQYEC